EAQVLQAEEHHVADPGEQLLVVVEREAELARDLLLAWRTAERTLEGVGDFLDEARLLAHAARHPVERAQVVEDGAADAELRVGGERRLLRRVVLADRVEQADDAPRHEVVELDVRGLPPREPLHNAADERQVTHEQLVAAAVERCGLRRGQAAPAVAQRPRRYPGVAELTHDSAFHTWKLMTGPRRGAGGRRTGGRRSG